MVTAPRVGTAEAQASWSRERPTTTEQRRHHRLGGRGHRIPTGLHCTSRPAPEMGL